MGADHMPNPDTPVGTGVMDRIPQALKAAAPREPQSASPLRAAAEHRWSGGSGPSALVETLIGMAGALIILALVYGSGLAIVPLLMAIPRS